MHLAEYLDYLAPRLHTFCSAGCACDFRLRQCRWPVSKLMWQGLELCPGAHAQSVSQRSGDTTHTHHAWFSASLLCFGPLLGTFFLIGFVFVANKLPKLALHRFEIMAKLFWKSPQSSMGPRFPKCGNSKKGGSPIIASGLGLSWVLVPIGPWSLERGRGVVRLGTGHTLRSKRGGGYFLLENIKFLVGNS